MIKLVKLGAVMSLLTLFSCVDPVSNGGGSSGSSHPNASITSYVAGPVLSSLSSDFTAKTFKVVNPNH